MRHRRAPVFVTTLALAPARASRPAARRAFFVVMAKVLTVAATSCSDMPSERLGATISTMPGSDQRWTDDD